MFLNCTLLQKRILIVLMTSVWVSVCQAQYDPCLGKSVFVIETATVTESQKLLPMIAPYQKIERDGIKYYCGTFNDYPVMLVHTGVGKVYAAVTNALLISTYHPRFILFVGLAGRLDPTLKYGDIVIGSEVYQVEHLKMSIGRTNKINPNTGLVYSPLLQPEAEVLRFVQTLPAFKNFSVVYGKIATTDEFPESKKLMKEIIKSNSRAIAMEDYAVIATCQLLDTNCLTVRALSDNPYKILTMQDENNYHIEEKERLLTTNNLTQYVRIFLETWLKQQQNDR
ncbi:5'-methylthioadenosine/S-adenosylhomocysteine nucleosidase [Legionella cardiaca]|uniref:5'-methylthioadenosine/S-adenosylhomocysteine nucleosidase n=1 Tax=Legionella cardiaca TaxID=1071983 RepID=A0ABY8AUW4_9GAMM|nr:5'-methylthioadenosine/S-adenosylhomocysteine nucleosidase [Legionella cardiaca]WED43539.1 5'-methylthioadenosine/S-adenosylhomocysteine nucleosidase [Legionella cardiaca]